MKEFVTIWVAMALIVFILVLTVLYLVPETSVGGQSVERASLHREIDYKAGVVCWHFYTYPGIDCMPIGQTNLATSPN